jgi:Zn-dependent metalloprotease
MKPSDIWELVSILRSTWKIYLVNGEDIERRAGSLALRSMSDPKSEGQPDTYGGTNWKTIECGTPTQANDYCGYTQTAVSLNWFYI